MYSVLFLQKGKLFQIMLSTNDNFDESVKNIARFQDL
jgi:hypothetical protein